MEDHALRACKASREQMELLKELRKGWDARQLPEIDIGIGLNTGPMSVGNMGSDRIFDYTVMGDNVNLGSRLEGSNKQYGTHIIISEYTEACVRDQLVCRELDLVTVKGKELPVQIYELVGALTDENRGRIELFMQGLEDYKKMAWQSALGFFEKAIEIGNDGPSKTYAERCKMFIEDPPGDDWDGVFRMTTK
jgi:adenylate cyclase